MSADAVGHSQPHVPFRRNDPVNPRDSWRFRCPEDHVDIRWSSSDTVACRGCEKSDEISTSTYSVDEVVDAKADGALADHLNRRAAPADEISQDPDVYPDDVEEDAEALPVPASYPCTCGEGEALLRSAPNVEPWRPNTDKQVSHWHYRHEGCPIGGTVVVLECEVLNRVGPLFHPARYRFPDLDLTSPATVPID